MRRIGEIRVPSIFGGVVTGGSISPDGRRVALCDYFQGYEIVLPAGSRDFQKVPGGIRARGSRRGRAVAGGDLPGHRSAGGTGGCRDPLDRRGRRGGRPPSRLRLRPRRGAGDDGGAGAAHPGQPDLGDQQRGDGAVHDLQGVAQRGGVPAVPEQVDRGGQQEDPADRGPVAGAQDAGGAGLGGGAQGQDRGVLPAGLLAGVEPGGIPEQRHEGRGEQGGPAGRPRNLARTHRGFMEQPGQRARNMSSVTFYILGFNTPPLSNYFDLLGADLFNIDRRDLQTVIAVVKLPSRIATSTFSPSLDDLRRRLANARRERSSAIL